MNNNTNLPPENLDKQLEDIGAIEEALTSTNNEEKVAKSVANSEANSESNSVANSEVVVSNKIGEIRNKI